MKGASFRAGITIEILEMGTSPRKDKSVFVMEIVGGSPRVVRRSGALGINFTLMKARDQGFSQMGIRSAATHSWQRCGVWG